MMDGELQNKIQSVLSDPESMQQLSELAKMLQGEAAEPAEQQPGELPSMPDAAMLMKLGEMMQGASADDKNTALLRALRPHLSEYRQQRVDKAVRLLRLWAVFRTMQKNGMLSELL